MFEIIGIVVVSWLAVAAHKNPSCSKARQFQQRVWA